MEINDSAYVIGTTVSEKQEFVKIEIQNHCPYFSKEWSTFE